MPLAAFAGASATAIPVRNSPNFSVEPVCNAVEIFVEQVRVDVERHAGLGVAGHVLYGRHVRAGTDRQRCGGMAQIVRRNQRERLVGLLALRQGLVEHSIRE